MQDNRNSSAQSMERHKGNYPEPLAKQTDSPGPGQGDESLSLLFDDISGINKFEDNSTYLANYLADDSTISAAGFLSQLKGVNEIEYQAIDFNEEVLKSRRDQSQESQLKENSNKVNKSQELGETDKILTDDINLLDITISKERYCSKETVKASSKYGAKIETGQKVQPKNYPQANQLRHKKSIADVNKTTQMLQGQKRRGSSLKDLLNKVDEQKNQLQKNLRSPNKPQIGAFQSFNHVFEQITGGVSQHPQLHKPERHVAKMVKMESSQVDQRWGQNQNQKQGTFIDYIKKESSGSYTLARNIQKKKDYTELVQDNIKLLENSGSLKTSNEEIMAPPGDTPKNDKFAWQKDMTGFSEKPEKGFLQKFFIPSVELQTQSQILNQRKPVIAKATVYHSSFQPVESPSEANSPTMTEGQSPVLGHAGVSFPFAPAKSMGYKQPSKKSFSRAESAQNTDRLQGGDKTDRIDNCKKPKRGTSSSGNRSNSKQSGQYSNKYKVKTLNDFLTSSKIQKNQVPATHYLTLNFKIIKKHHVNNSCEKNPWIQTT